MNSKSLISVVIPTYNRLQPTIRAVTSVLEQSWRPLELIVIDDGSTDGSTSQLETFLGSCSVPGIDIIFIRQKNSGPAVARNEAVARARGRYVAFLDSDDTWTPDKLERQIEVLTHFPECGACCSDARYQDRSGMDESTFSLFGRRYPQPSGVDRAAPALLAKSFCGFFLSSLLVETDILRRVGGLDPEISFAEDRDLYFRLSLLTPLAYVNAPLVTTDRSPTPEGSGCRPWDKVEVRLRGFQRMYEKWLNLGPSLAPDLRRIVERELQSTHCHWANWHLENKRYDRAREAVSHAIRYHVSPKMGVKWALTWTAPAVAARVSGKTSSYL